MKSVLKSVVSLLMFIGKKFYGCDDALGLLHTLEFAIWIAQSYDIQHYDESFSCCGFCRNPEPFPLKTPT